MVSQLFYNFIKMRVKFRKGEQRKFLKEVIVKANLPSIREIINHLVDVKYSSLRNYYIERRLLPLELFEELCHLSDMSKDNFNVKIIDEHWGQVKGGKKK